MLHVSFSVGLGVLVPLLYRSCSEGMREWGQPSIKRGVLCLIRGDSGGVGKPLVRQASRLIAMSELIQPNLLKDSLKPFSPGSNPQSKYVSPHLHGVKKMWSEI